MHYIALPVTIDQQVMTGLARRLRDERSRRRWTLDDLAARSGISRRLLVQIEQAEANPSLTTLLKLAAALDATLTDLIAENPTTQAVSVLSERDARTLWSTPAGSTARLLVGHGPLELWAWTLAPGDRRDSEAHRPGSVELLSVQTGSVTVHLGEQRVDIRTGDSARFEATGRHAYVNPGPTCATFNLVVFEPA